MRPYFRTNTLLASIGALCLYTGVLVLVTPHQFKFLGFETLHFFLPFIGTVALFTGLALVAYLVLEIRRSLAGPIHILGGAILAFIAFIFALAGVWFEAIHLLLLALGLAFSLMLRVDPQPQTPENSWDFFPLFMSFVSLLSGLLLLRSGYGGSYPGFESHFVHSVFGYVFLLVGAGVILAFIAQQKNWFAFNSGRFKWIIGGLQSFLGLIFLVFALFALLNHSLWITAGYFALFGLVLLFVPWVGKRFRLPSASSVYVRLALLLAVTALLPLVATVVLITEREEALVREEVLSELNRQAALISIDLYEYINTRQTALLGLAAQPGFMDQPPERQQEQLHFFSQLFPDLSFFALYDASGIRVVDSRENLRASQPANFSISGYPIFEDAKKSGLPTMEIIHFPEKPFTVVWIGAPVVENGVFKGLLTFELTSTQLSAFIESKDVFTLGRMYLVDTQGYSLVHPGPDTFASRTDLSHSPPVQALLTANESGSLQYWKENDYVLAGYARSPDLGWGLVSERFAAGDAMAGVYEGRETVFLALGLFFFLAVAVGLALSGRITNRLSSLSMAANQLAVGNFDAPLPRSRIHELDSLSTAFGNMRRQLAQQIDSQEQIQGELRQAKQELETRVIERTEELRRTNNALATSNQRLRTILDTAPAAIWIADPDGKIVHKNNMVDMIWGMDAPLSLNVEGYSEYKGWWSDSGEEIEANEWALARAVQKGEISVGEVIDILRFDGQMATILNSAAPVFDDQGEIAGAVVISQDITHQRVLEKQARQQADELDGIFDALADAVIVYDTFGKVIKANPTAVELMGMNPLHLSREEIFQRLALLDESGQKVELSDFPTSFALSHQITLNKRFILVNHKSHRYHIRASASPLYSHGKLTGVVAIWHDVTERENLLAENQRNRELLEAIFAIHPGGLAVLAGDELEYQLANPAYCELTPNPSVNPVGKSYEEIWPYTEGFQVRTLLKQVLQTGESVHSERHKRVYPDGTVRYFSFHINQISWKDRQAVLSVLWETSSLEFAQHSIAKSAAEAQERAEQLALERARLQAVLDHAPAGVIMSGMDGRLSLVNQAANIMFGGSVTGDVYSPAGGYTLHYLNGDLIPSKELPIPKTLAGRHPVEGYELLIRHDSGRDIIVLVNTTPVFTPQDELAGVVAVMQDITDRKRREDQIQFLVNISDLLSHSMEPLELVESVVSRLGVFLRVDLCMFVEIGTNGRLIPLSAGFPHSRFRDGSQDWYSVFSRSLVDKLGRGSTIAVSDTQSHPLTSGDVEQVFAPAGIRSFVLVPQSRGSAWPAALLISSGEVRSWSTEEILFVQGVANRLWLAYENSKLLLHIMKSEERFRTSVENLLDGFAILSAIRETNFDGKPGRILDFQFEYVNQAGCRMNQRTLEEQVGNSLLELLPAHLETGLLDEYIQLVETGNPIIKDALFYEDIYGSGEKLNRVFEMQAVKLGDGFALTWRDVTEKHNMELTLANYAAQLEHSNRELEQFAFVASHDLQEPLRKVKVFSEILFEKAASRLDGDERDYLNRMLNAVERMQTMIKDLLAFSRVITKGQPFTQVDLVQVSQEVVSDLEIRIARSGGRVEIGELPTLEADPMQMRQLILNLLGNGVKFQRPNVPPLVKIYSLYSDDSGTVRFAVEDNGIGFDPQYTKRIFQPFERLHGKNRYEGTGMGLAICQKIVERHHGEIIAKSVPDQGSTFIVTLPLRQPEQA
jgi:PAS domain S-box-containing protein